MALAIKTLDLKYGFKLVFHYDDGFDLVQQCGDLNYYESLIEQLVYQSLEYYTLMNGTNKFLRHVVLHIYADFIPYADPPSGTDAYSGGFWTYSDGSNNSHINAHFIDYNQSTQPGQVPFPYRYPSALSHEMGHAYHNWCGWAYPVNGSWAVEVKSFLERMFSSNHTAYDLTKTPWNIVGQNVNAYEQFANAFRYFNGALTTRGISGLANNGSDPVITGFEDPANHPEWAKVIRLMPELCAFMMKNGCQPNTLEWFGGVDGYFVFRCSNGSVVRQRNYWSWDFNLNGLWIPYWPIYFRN